MGIVFAWSLIIDNSHVSLPSHSLNFSPPHPQLHLFLMREFFQSPDYLGYKYTDDRQQWWITTKATQNFSSLFPGIYPNATEDSEYMLLFSCVWKWKSLSLVWLFVTSWTMHGILQARILEWVAFPFSRECSQPRDWTKVSQIVGRFFIRWATREAQEPCSQ